MTARDVWRWTDERGVQRLVGTDELRTALSSGVLPPSTLVWREGMKDWLPASSMPELASAAFAASEPAPPADVNPGRSTLVGITSNPPGAAPAKSTKVQVEVPAPTGVRSAVTQIPPFGAPGRRATPVPPAPRVPLGSAPGASANTPGLAAATAELPKPKRKPANSDVDAHWATTTNSDEDETIPRRARPSELAAAAAAQAEASGTLRDLRARAKLEAEGRRGTGMSAPSIPKAPLRKPPPFPGKAKLDSGGEVTPKESAPPRPPPRPPLRSKPPALPTPTASGSKPPELPTSAPSAIAVPVKPIVRIKPPDAPSETTDAALELQETAAGAPVPAVEPPAAAKSAAAGAPADAAPAPAPQPAGPDAAPDATPSPEPPAAGKTTPASPREPAAPAPAQTPAATAFVAAAEITIPMNGAASHPGPAEGIVARPPGPIEDADSVTAPSRALVAAALAGAGMLPEAEPAPQSARRGPPPLPPSAPTFGAPPSGPHRREWGSTPLPPIAALLPPGATPQPPPAKADAPPAEPSADAGAAPQANGSAVLTQSPAAHSLPPAAAPEPEPAVEKPAENGGASRVSAAPLLARRRRRILEENVSVPISSLLGSGGLLIGMVVAAFFVGRASAASVPRLVARPSFGSVPVRARAAIPPPPRPCWMAKQPAMWAPHASRSIPFETAATKGGALAIGYARDSKEAVGIAVDLVTGEVKKRFDDKGGDEIERVMPTSGGEFRVTRAGASKLTSAVEVPAATPFAVGLAAGAVALAAPPSASPSPLWPIAGDEALGAAAVHAEGDRGFALTYRRGGAIWGGFIGADRKAKGEIVKVNGSGGAVGKPGSAWNGRELAVVFADRPEGSNRYEIRIGHAPAGAIPTTTVVFPLPRGGPGGDAFAPDIAGLDDGRWVLTWTEGAQGSRAVRAQTLASDFRPLGDPIALSPPAGNFGQAVAGVVGNHVATVFLSKGSSSYELWGAVLQCGG